MIRVAIVGASGRLGSVAARVVGEHDDFDLAATLNSSNELTDMVGADVVFDATNPAVSPSIVDYAVSAGIPIVVGTSGWSRERIDELAARIDQHSVFIVPNFSVGSVLATTFAALAAPFFDSIEIIEAHHAGKVDSPSGTATRTAELVSEARHEVGPTVVPYPDQPARGQLVAGIPVHSLRMAGVLAKQEVVLGGLGETVSISHVTTASSSYEAGIALALRAVPALSGVHVGLETLLTVGAAAPPGGP